MILKDIYKKNSIVISEEGVVKSVRMPFSFLGNLCSQHEANALLKLGVLGFAHAPKLLCHHDNVLSMTRIEGSALSEQHRGNKELFLSVLRCVSQLHSLGFAHGNITRKNVLVSDRGEVYLIDFETSCRKGNPAFCVLKLWDYVRLYRLALRVFHLKKDETRRLFPGSAIAAIHLTRPLYKLRRIAKHVQRGARRIVGGARKNPESRLRPADAAQEWGKGVGGQRDERSLEPGRHAERQEERVAAETAEQGSRPARDPVLAPADAQDGDEAR